MEENEREVEESRAAEDTESDAGAAADRGEGGRWRLWALLKLVAVALFFWVLPPLCLLKGLNEFALLLVGVGLIVDVLALRQARRPLLIGSVVFHLTLGGLGAALCLRPLPGDWEQMPGSSRHSEVMLFQPEERPLLVMGEDEIYEVQGSELRPLQYPGGFAWELGEDAVLGIWAAPRDNPRLHYHQRQESRWLSWPRPEGHLAAMATSQGQVFIVVEGQLHQGRPGVFWTQLGDEHVDDVSVGGPILAVGERWRQSEDRGQSWQDVTPDGVSISNPEAVLGGGWRYVYRGGTLTSDLYVSPPGRPFERRDLPASDVRVALVNPDNGAELWIGTWGEGIHRSLDGGESWQNLGLQGVQCRALAIDWQTSRAYAASANLVFRKGLYVLPFTPAPSRSSL